MSDIKKALANWIPGDVHSLKWLEEFGVTQSSAGFYWRKGVLQKVAAGLYAVVGHPLNWESAVRVLQKEMGLNVHVGGLSSLGLQGKAQYGVLSDNPPMRLVFSENSNVPKWLRLEDTWGVRFRIKKSKLINGDQCLIDYGDKNSIKIASKYQAILEFINGANLQYSFEEVKNHVEFLRSSRGEKFQKVLEKCSSVKVKRVFLYVSELLEMPYFKDIDISKIDLGSGARKIIENGEFDNKYKITVERKEDDNPF